MPTWGRGLTNKTSVGDSAPDNRHGFSALNDLS